MKSPVAFFVYKREDCTRRVWDAIRAAKPPVLLLIADGPRDEADRVKCEATRAILGRIDWPCDVRRHYAPTNMGCRDRMASGLSWVFEQVEEAIILEDDCVPGRTFFQFCDELLEKYRDDLRVMHIGGTSFQRRALSCEASYYFSNCVLCWGWATWRRAWRCFDQGVKTWPRIKQEGVLKSVCGSHDEFKFWTSIFNRQYRGASKAWDYSWVFAVWANHGLAVTPVVNLVSNIGVGADSTHRQDSRWYMNLPAGEMGALLHPGHMMINVDADRRTYNDVHRPSLLERARESILNPWAYTSALRKIPFIGPCWAGWREWCKRK